MEKKKAFLINFAFYGLIAALCLLFLKYGLKYVLPFVLGYIIAYICRRPTEFICSKLKMKNKVASILVLSVAIILLVLIFIILIGQLGGGLTSLFRALPAFYTNQVEPYVQKILQWYENTDLEEYIGETAAQILEATADKILQSLGSLVTTLSVRVVSFLTGVIGKVPNFMMTFLLTIISAFFISIDYENISGFLAMQLKPRTRELLTYVKVNLVDTLGKYIVSYSLILFITFIELNIVLLIAGVPNSFLLALLISFFDILPIVGTGTVFWPWFAIDMVAGNYKRAIIIIAGYFAITIIRNIIEPRIVGQKVGLHPIVTLIAMFIGLRAYGLIGMLMLPVLLVMLNEMQKKDIIHLYKTDPDRAEAEET